MRDGAAPRPPLVDRGARLAYAFIVMNCAAVAGLVAAALGRKVWH